MLGYLLKGSPDQAFTNTVQHPWLEADLNCRPWAYESPALTN